MWESTQTESAPLKRINEMSCMARLTDDRTDILTVIYDETSLVGGRKEFGSFPRWMNVVSSDYPQAGWQYGKRQSFDLNCDNEKLKDILITLKETAIEVNKNYSKQLGIPQSTAITCVKPSGTVSQLVDSASGIHARHSKYYIRTVRGDNKDPLTQFMIDSGIPHEPDVMKPDSTTVFSFPMKSPEGAVTRNDISAIDQLRMWQTYQEAWCEHKPSVTITVKEDEWLEVGDWVYRNFDEISGISFLPHSDHTYAQAPYQEITKKQYKKLDKSMPNVIDWSLLQNFEKEDNTTGNKELACVAGVCEVVDIQAS